MQCLDAVFVLTMLLQRNINDTFFPASNEISAQIINDKGHWILSKLHSFDRL